LDHDLWTIFKDGLLRDCSLQSTDFNSLAGYYFGVIALDDLTLIGPLAGTETTMDLDKHRLFLVGFMGAGKSTIGPLLARRLNWEFCDLDEQIEEEQKCSVREIFRLQGESRFRDLEAAALRRTTQMESIVVALGGGAFTFFQNQEMVRQLGLSIFLDCPLDVALRRCTVNQERPLFRDREKARALYQSRRAFYLMSDLVIETGERSPDQIVEIILERLETLGYSGSEEN
jgi:shikimate kinase